MFYTFYSYKGGVGRSMALVNIAELMCRNGLNVLMVDWDLEAPGLERFFHRQVKQALMSPGVIDMLLAYMDEVSQFKSGDGSSLFPVYDIKDYMIELKINPSSPGRLWLLPAGQRTGNQFVDYSNHVKMFNWQDFYLNWKGEIYFEWLREELDKFADVVLIDSRTGVTEMGGVCTYQLADVVVMFCAANEQNIDGTLQMVKSFSDSQLQELRYGRPLKTLVVPSRVERLSETESLNVFRKEFAERFEEFIPAEFRAKPDFYLQLEIPYIPLYAFEEIIAVNQTRKRQRSIEMEQAYTGLLQILTTLAPEDSAIRKHLQIPIKKTDGATGELPAEIKETWDDLQLARQTIALTPAEFSRKPQHIPFVHGGPVPPSHFIGRRREVEQILGLLANPARASSAISGDPRVGKTSLLHYLLGMPQLCEAWDLSPSYCHFLYLDCHSIVPFSEADFWRFILRELKRYLEDDEALTQNIEQLLAQTNFDLPDLHDFFDNVAGAGRLVVIMLDEFEWIMDNLDRNSPRLLNHLRALLNRQERGLALILANRVSLRKLCADFHFTSSPFDNVFTHLTLPPFSRWEVGELLHQYQAVLSPDERTFLDQIAGTHPYLIQLTTSLIVRADREHNEAEISLTQIEDTLEHETEEYFSEIFNYSDEIERMLLALLALLPLSQHLPPDRVLGDLTKVFGRYEREMDHLVNRGFVLNQSGNLMLFSPIFTRWVLRRVIVAEGLTMLSDWEGHLVNDLSPAQKHALENLVNTVINWPDIIKRPELLVDVSVPEETSLSPLLAGEQVLGRYTVETLIGAGSTTDIFKARDPRLDRLVTIKRLRPILADKEDVRSRFQREAQAIAKLRHPNIVQIFDFGIEDNRYYTVMEFIEGHDLKTHLGELVTTGETLSWQEMLRITTYVAEALDYAHQREMIHRDVKPANILLTDDGGVFLTDFGLMRLLGPTELTDPGGIVGTPAYMAPEQITNHHIDCRVDIYALASVVYEMVTGRTPFEQADFPMGILNVNPPPPHNIVPDLPEAASQVILRALAKDPAKRPSSTIQFIEDLRQEFGM